MPPMTARRKDAWPEHDTFVRVVAFDCLCVPASDLQRSISFYAALFAMRVVAGDAGAGRAVLSRGGRVRLALYAHRRGPEMPVTRIAARVESLEAARDMVWDLGIATLQEPGDGWPSGGTNSFAIADPDGHEIRFFERSQSNRSR